MRCVGIGELRALLDGELPGGQRQRVEQHLESCAVCRGSLDALSANASFVGSALRRFAPEGSAVPRVAWSSVRDRVERPVTLDRRIGNVFGSLFGFVTGSRLRIATSAVAVVVAVALLFTLTPVQTAASSFLSLFRVKKFVAVTVDPASLPNIASPVDLGEFTITGDQKTRQVSLAETEKAVGFKVQTPATLPSGMETAPRSVDITSAISVTYTPDLAKVRAYLASIGASNVRLPDNLDGAPITLQVPPAVAVLYAEKGGIERTPDGLPKPLAGSRFLFLGATAGPTLSVPDGLDVELVRTEILKMPGLPQDLVKQLKAVEDWRNTVVVPVVKGTSREVTVQGEKGLLISETGGKGTTLLWLKGGIVYTLTGSVSEAEILAAANSMR